MPAIPQAPPPADPEAGRRSPYTVRGRSPYASGGRENAAETVAGASGAPGGGAGLGAGGDGGGAGGASSLPHISRAPVDGVSVTSVVTGALGLGPVALGLGVWGLRRTTRQWRRSPAIAGTGLALGIAGTLAWLGLGVAAGLGAFSGPDLTARPGDVPSAVSVHAQALAPGNCVETLPPQQEVGELRLVPCAETHLAQVLSTDDLTEQTYPGPEATLTAAQEECAAELRDQGFDEESFLAWPIVPSPSAWDEGTRTTACLARSTIGPILGDLRTPS